MTLRDYLSRFTATIGLAGPSLSYKPREPDVAVARRVVRFLEDRRVFFADSNWEVPDLCVESVIEIRRCLTEELGSDLGPRLAGPLQLMRAACRQFLDRIGISEDVRDPNAGRRYLRPREDFRDYLFALALGELRATIGIQLAIILDSHKIDIEGPLTRILPALD